ncbi:unnamed protein product, partial [Symbiodinium sp. CCMP2456]
THFPLPSLSMIMDDVIPADSGEVVLLRVNQRALQLDGESSPAVGYCVMRRPGGLLLALPATFLPQEVLSEAAQDDFAGVLGPSTITSAPVVELAEGGEWVGVYPTRNIDVLLADFADSALSGIELLDEGLSGCVPFVAENPHLFPLATALVEYAVAWAGVRAKAVPDPKRRPTVAALAAQQTEIVKTLQALATQVQVLAKGGAQVPADPPPQPVAPVAARPALVAPVSATVVAPPTGPRAVANLLGPPPRGRPAVNDAAEQDPGLDGLPLTAGELGQPDEGSSITAAFLAQSRALTALVSQIAGQNDPLSDLAASGSSISTKGSAARLKLQRELSSRTGVFFDKVYEAATRRMEPTADTSMLAAGVSQGPVMTRYMERYGGFRDYRTWGLVQWQLAQAFDLLATEQVAGAKDVIALLMVMVDQIVLDAGSPDLGWLLTLQPDPPAPLFTAQLNTPGSSLRSCSHLSDPKWVATALSYIKEMETLSARRGEAARKAPPGTPDPPAGKGQPSLTRKQQRAKLWAERKASAAVFGSQFPVPAVAERSYPRLHRRGFKSSCRHVMHYEPPLTFRLVLRSGTSFAKFLGSSFCISDRGPAAPNTALFPLPVPSLGLFDAGILESSPPGLSSEPTSRRILLERVLYVVVLGLNYLHADFKHVPTDCLRRLPTELHLKVFDRLRSMLRACSEKGEHPLASGRRGPHLIARLRELNAHISGLGLSTFPYPSGISARVFVPHDADGPEALRPYRDADPDRLKISGTGSWNLEAFLSPELRLAYREPHVLRSIPPNLLPGPDGDAEPRDRTLRLMRLWDTKGLLFISFQKKEQREVTRVFGSYKSETADRQIGSYRQATILCQLSVPPGHRLIGASTDRADFYHQAKITASKAEGNCIGPSVRLGDLEGTATLERARALASLVDKKGAAPRRLSPLGEACLVSANVPRSLLQDGEAEVRGAFRSLYQGDHAGVEFATQAHTALLQASGLLTRETQLLAKHAPSRGGPWEGLIIDDFFSLSSEKLHSRPEDSTAAAKVRQAKACYSQAGVAGSPHKDIDGSDLFLAAGAQVDSTAGTASEGRVYVSASTPKLLALSFLSLKAAALPVITEELASNLAGSWISVVMYRRALFSVLDGFFSLGKSEASQATGSHLRFFP